MCRDLLRGFILLMFLHVSQGYAEKGQHRYGLIPSDPQLNPNLVEVRSLPLLSRADALPIAVDLSSQMPPVGNQGSQGSCVAWAFGYYHKTHTEWVEHHWDITLPQNQYSPAFLYHLINGGVDNGSYFDDAAKIIVDNGIASLSTMPYSQSDYTTWPSETAFETALTYRCIATVYTVVTDDNGLSTVKTQLSNGYTAVTGINVYDNFEDIGSYNNTYCVADAYGSLRGRHAVTIVGYNDTMQTRDGIGAFKLVNSWGTSWGASGYWWMSYKAMKGSTLSQRFAYWVTDRAAYTPQLIVRTQLTHAARTNVGIRFGFGPTSSPRVSKDFFNLTMSTQTNRAFPSSRMVFDLSDNIASLGPDSMVFLRCIDKSSDANSGTINYLSAEVGGSSKVSIDPPVSIPDYNTAAYATLKVQIIAGKHLSATPDSLRFGTVLIGGNSSLQLSLSNIGNDTTTISALTLSSGTFSHASTLPLKIPPYNTRGITLTFTPNRASSENDTLKITSNAIDNPVIAVSLSGTGTLPPQITVSPAFFHQTLYVGDSVLKSITIANPGMATLVFSIAEAAVIANPFDWLTFSPASGSVNGGNSTTINSKISARTSGTGRFISNLNITHNASGTVTPFAVPCTLDVIGIKRLSVSSASLDFGKLWIGKNSLKSLTFQNTGSDTTTISAISSSNSVFNCTAVLPLKIPPSNSRTVQIKFTPTRTARETSTVTVTSNAQDNPFIAVSVIGNGLFGPAASIRPDSLYYSLLPSSTPATQQSILHNNGGDTLVYQITAINEISRPSLAALDNSNPLPAIQANKIYSDNNYKNLYIKGRIIIGMSQALVAADQSLLTKAGAVSMRELGTARNPETGFAVNRFRRAFLLMLADTTSDGVLKAIERLHDDPSIAFVEPDYVVKLLAIPNDPSFSQLYGMYNIGQNGGTVDADIDATDVWERHTGNRTLRIGIIDTGIDYLHPDLAANIWTNPGEISGNGIDDDNNGFIDDIHGWDFANDDNDPMDDHYHGTHCAGTIAAVGNNGIGVAGVMWNASLVALKFLSGTGGGSVSDAIDAVNYANAMGIQLTSNSWGGGSFSQALMDAISRGGLFVAAAGNEGTNNDASPHYPSSYNLNNIIAVAATDRNEAIASFSCYGRTSVDLGAPGVDIYSCSPGSSYRTLSGTSMATPHVSGSAGLIWTYAPQMTALEIKQMLMENVDPISSLTNKCITGGRLNVAKALAATVPGWLTASPMAGGKIAPNDSAVISMTVTSTGLQAGQWVGQIVISTNDSLNLQLPVKVVADINSTLPTVSFETSSETIQESLGITTVRGVLSLPSITDVSVPFTVSGTASNSVDHNLTSGTIIIRAGSVKDSVRFQIVNDLLDENNETVVLTMGTPTNAVPGAPNVHTVNIIDDDSAPTIQFTSATQNVLENAGTAIITAQLSAVSGLPVTVPFTVSGTATGGGIDYTITASPITIPSGSMSGTINISVVNDALQETDKTIVVTMGAPTNATVGAINIHTATILDNDSNGFITITGLDSMARVYLYASSGWLGVKQFNGNGTLTLQPGKYQAAIVQKNKRTEYLLLTSQRGMYDTVAVQMRSVVPMIFDTLERVVDANGSDINIGSIGSAVMEDIDRDGNEDLVTLSRRGILSIYYGESSGLQSPQTYTLSMAGGEDAWCLRIIDNDTSNVLDYLVGLNNGEIIKFNGSTLARSTVYTAENGLTSIELCDFNADNNFDLLLGYGDGTVDYAASNGIGGFLPAAPVNSDMTTLSVGTEASVMSMVVDGDSLPDLLIGNRNGDVSWFKRKIDGTYTTKGAVDAGGRAMSLTGGANLAFGFSGIGQLPKIVATDNNGYIYKSNARLTGDFDSDGTVEFSDYMMLVNAWNTLEGDLLYDRRTNVVLSTGSSQRIDFYDYMTFLTAWTLSINR